MDSDDKKQHDEDASGGLMGKLLDSRTIIISGGTDSLLAQKVIQQLILLDHADSKKRITILINSPGGEVFSGFAIFDTARFISAPVVTVVVGLAASMGSILALCAPKGSRYATPNAKFLIHQPLLMGYQGRATDLEIQAKEILKDRERIVELYAKTTGKDAKEVAKDIDRDKWMTAEEALAYGLIDKIVKSRTELPGG
ncbi:MAG TPA: ATP-dependent Clp protease proteolytic subunit [bacterium]